MIQKLGRIPLQQQPGTKWQYGVAIDVLGYLIEVITDEPLDAFLEQRIFQPLGMKDTGFHVPREKIGRFAAMYGLSDTGNLTLIDAPATSQFVKSATFFSGGGGLVSTVSDYMRFAQMLLNGGELNDTRLLSRKTVEMMTMNQLGNELIPIGRGSYGQSLKGYGFGLGFRVRTDIPQSELLGSMGEFGWAGAAETFFLVDPEEDLIGLVMAQFRPPRYYPIRRQFATLIYQAIVD